MCKTVFTTSGFYIHPVRKITPVSDAKVVGTHSAQRNVIARIPDIAITVPDSLPFGNPRNSRNSAMWIAHAKDTRAFKPKRT